MKKITSKTISENGQSLVEFALSLTVIMMLLAGVVEFGIALFQYVQLRDAAQEGALYGSIHPDDNASIVARVEAASDKPINLHHDASTNVTCLATNGSVIDCSTVACEGDGIQVEVTYQHRISMPFIGAIIGSNTIPLTARVTDTILQPLCSP